MAARRPLYVASGSLQELPGGDGVLTDHLLLPLGPSVPTPASGQVAMHAKADKRLAYKDSAGAVFDVGPVRLVKGADQGSTSTAFADVTDLTVAVAASATMVFEFVLFYTTAATTTAIQLSVNGPASPTFLRYSVEVAMSATGGTATTGWHQAVQTAYDTVLNPTTGGAATALPARVYGSLVNGANAGTLALRMRSEIATSAVTILRGSYGIIY